MIIEQIRKGKGEFPKKGETVEVELKYWDELGNILENTFDGCVSSLRFEIGKDEVVEWIEEFVKTMQEGEHSLFSINNCRIEILLLKILKNYDLLLRKTDIEIMMKCTSMKEAANEIFQCSIDPNPKKALKKYKMGLLLMEQHENARKNKMWENEEFGKKWDALVYVFHLNISACSMKLKRYQECIKHCDLCLGYDSNSTKALYRKGCAFDELQEYDKAILAFECALRNPKPETLKEQIQKSLEKSSKSKVALEKKLKNTYSKLFTSE